MINNKEFLIGKVPDFHPIADRYESREWWKEQKRRCIEGYWVGGKWMPPELYYYVNFHNIKYETDSGISTAMGMPWLRDIEWEKAYLYTEACGFSGFERDTKFTCDRRYGPEKEIYLRYGWITQEEINSKEYIDIRDYLARPYSENLGKPIYRNKAKNVMDLEGRGCLGKGMKVLMYDSSIKNIEDVVIGDLLMGKDDTPRRVLDTHTGKDNLFKISHNRYGFDDLIVNSKHTLSIILRKRINGKYYNRVRDKGTYSIEQTSLPINEIFEKQTLSSFNDSYYRYKPETTLTFDEIIIPKINPYYMGLWLADGRSNCTSIKITDEVLWDYLRKFADNNNIEYKETITLAKDNRKEAREFYYKDEYFRQEFKNYGLVYTTEKTPDKRIPTDYFKSSEQDRLSLLAGIIDGDGNYDKTGDCLCISVGVSKSLAEDYLFLCRSLGFFANITQRQRDNQQLQYIIRLNGDLSRIPTKLQRKIVNKIDHRINLYSSSFKIEEYGYGDYYGLVVDNDNEYLLADFSVDHNSGKSYWASGCIAHNFLFDGARDYDAYLERKRNKEPFVSDTVVGAIDAKYSNDLLDKVKLGIENLPGKSSIITIDGETEDYASPLYVKYTGSLASGKKWVNRQGSVLNHRTFADNPLAANGTRPNRVFLEEVGFMSNIIEAWGAIEATQAAAEGKRLVIYGLGTGGLTTAGAALYTQEIFYHPEAYNCVSFLDIYEDKGRNRKIAYFLPAPKTRNAFKEGENKITNMERATEAIKKEIEDAKQSGSRTAYLAKVINNPLVPSDIFLRAEGVFFPIHQLKEALADLERNQLLLNASYKVDLRFEEGNVKMYPSSMVPINEYPLTRSSMMDACIEIFEKPKLNADQSVAPNRYIMSVDPVDDDGNDDTSRSLQSAFVLDTYTDRIVAEYTARTYLAETYYENVRKLAILYNARILYENNKKGLYGHFKNKNALWMLIETPQILKDQDIIKSTGIGNRSLGVNVTDAVKIYGIQLILKWLELPSYTNPDKKNLNTIRSLGLLKELIAYSLDINADRVSSLLVLMIFREELGERITDQVKGSIKSTANDPFWKKPLGYNASHKVYNMMGNNPIRY